MKQQEPLEKLKTLAPLTGLSYQTLLNWRCQNKLPFPVYVIPPGSIRPELLARRSDVFAWLEKCRQEPKKANVERLL
jgi:hypothetical protein